MTTRDLGKLGNVDRLSSVVSPSHRFIASSVDSLHGGVAQLEAMNWRRKPVALFRLVGYVCDVRPTSRFIMSRIRLASCIAILAPILAPYPTCGADKPNIVYILADDLGYGDVGCYNPQSQIPTPALERLASPGMGVSD